MDFQDDPEPPNGWENRNNRKENYIARTLFPLDFLLNFAHTGCMNIGKLDLVGGVFGKLTVISEGPRSVGRAKARRWHCVCSCGGTTLTTTTRLISGHTTQCGCEHPNRRVVVIGSVVGSYRVLGRALPRGASLNLYYTCVCLLCGTATEVRASHLRKAAPSQCPKCARKNRRGKAVENTYGRLTVIRRVRNRSYLQRLWPNKAIYLCRCSCGKYAAKTGAALRLGTRSCGCLIGIKYRGLDRPSGIKNANRPTDARYRALKQAARDRDKHCCVACQSKLKLEIHHVYGWKEWEHLRFELSNLRTLCKKCHGHYHSVYGIRNVNPDDFKEFVKIVKEEKRSKYDC